MIPNEEEEEALLYSCPTHFAFDLDEDDFQTGRPTFHLIGAHAGRCLSRAAVTAYIQLSPLLLTLLFSLPSLSCLPPRLLLPLIIMETANRYARLPLSQQPDESWLSQHQAWQATQQAAWVRDGGLLFSDEEQEAGDEEAASPTQHQIAPELLLSDEEDTSLAATSNAAAVDPDLLLSDEEEDASMAAASIAAIESDLTFSDDEEASLAQASMAATLGDYSMNLLDEPPEVEEVEEEAPVQQDAAADGIQGESEVSRAHRERLTEQ